MIYEAFRGREVSAQADAVETLSFLLASKLEGLLPKLWRAPSSSTLSVSSLLGGAYLCSSVAGGGKAWGGLWFKY